MLSDDCCQSHDKAQPSVVWLCIMFFHLRKRVQGWCVRTSSPTLGQYHRSSARIHVVSFVANENDVGCQNGRCSNFSSELGVGKRFCFVTKSANRRQEN